MPVVAYLSWPVSTRWDLLGLPVFPHGLLIAAGFALGAAMLVRAARRHGIDADAVGDVVVWIAAGAIVGARLFWVAGSSGELDSPLDALALWQGGLTLFGGIAGGTAAGIVAARRRGLPIVRLVDLAMPGLAAGLALGRVACLVVGDHLGTPTALPWGFRYVGSNPPGAAPALGAIVHPVALYDLVSVLALLGALVWLSRRAHAGGAAVALFAGWYALDRLALDFLRTDPIRALGLTGTQLASIGVLASVTVWLVAQRRRRAPAPVAV